MNHSIYFHRYRWQFVASMMLFFMLFDVISAPLVQAQAQAISKETAIHTAEQPQSQGSDTTQHSQDPQTLDRPDVPTPSNPTVHKENTDTTKPKQDNLKEKQTTDSNQQTNQDSDQDDQSKELETASSTQQTPFDQTTLSKARIESSLSPKDVQVDVFTGAASFNVPLRLPPGRNNQTPPLSLFYHSRQTDNDSLYGYGWDLPIGSISRDKRLGAAEMYANPVSFTLDLFGRGGRLIQITSDGESFYGTYGLEIDDAFYRIKADSDGWTVTAPDGSAYLFGRIDQARQYDPGNPAKIFSWHLHEIKDTFGNKTTITYTRVSSYNRVYPKTISYTGFEQETAPYEVEFVWESRPDSFQSYSAGFLLYTTLRLSAIDIKAEQRLIRRYSLTYTSGANTKRSLLEKITETAWDTNNTQQDLPPLAFSYTKGPTGWEDVTNQYTFPQFSIPDNALY